MTFIIVKPLAMDTKESRDTFSLEITLILGKMTINEEDFLAYAMREPQEFSVINRALWGMYIELNLQVKKEKKAIQIGCKCIQNHSIPF